MMSVYSLIIHERVAGNWDAQSYDQNQKIIMKQTPRIVVGMEGTRGFGQPWLVFLGGWGVKLYLSIWELPIMCLAWNIVRSLGYCVDNET